ncbi:hypothetical protein AVEN_130186-1, partial [Araneus ventricosus]
MCVCVGGQVKSGCLSEYDRFGSSSIVITIVQQWIPGLPLLDDLPPERGI